jgi:hypothetical protein
LNPYEPPQSSPHDPALRPPPTPVDATDDAVATVIPYKNAPALIAYYLGLFSIAPLIGFPMAIAAIVLGIMGLKTVRRNPQAHGTAHAWVGVGCGTLALVFNGLLIAGLIITLVFGASRH